MSGLLCGSATAKGTPCSRPAVNDGPCAWHDPVRKPEGRVWTKERRFKLESLVEQGLPDPAIARRLHTTSAAIHLARKRYRIPCRRAAVMTARAIADVMGVGCAKSVTRWVDCGYLRGKRGWRQGQHRVLMVSEADFLAFLEDPDHWHRWDPDRISDPLLREWAQELRRGVRFLTLSEVAERYFVQAATVHSWIKKGYLPAVRNGNHLVRESDLASFTLPELGQGSRRRTWEPCALCGDPHGRVEAGCVTPARRNGARYGVAGLVCTRCHRRLRTVHERAERITA